MNRFQNLQLPALLAAVLIVGANALVLSPILPEVAAGLRTEPHRAAWAISAFGAATATSALLLGGLIDRAPAGRLLGGAGLALALALGGAALSRNWAQLCLSQIAAGAATGIILPGVYATSIATAAPGREAARLAVVMTGWALSLVLAVPLSAAAAEAWGWRVVYLMLAALAACVAALLPLAMREAPAARAQRVPLRRALALPGIAPMLLAVFAFMTAFYGLFAYFGQGMRAAFGLSAQGAGLFVLAYGVGFGAAGVGLGIAAPTLSRRYVALVLLAVAASYASWRLAVTEHRAALLAAGVWGFLNQMGLNALVAALGRRADGARGAVMGLNTAVTYLAVFAGPLLMGPIFAAHGFPAAALTAAALLTLAALSSWRAG